MLGMVASRRDARLHRRPVLAPDVEVSPRASMEPVAALYEHGSAVRPADAAPRVVPGEADPGRPAAADVELPAPADGLPTGSVHAQQHRGSASSMSTSWVSGNLAMIELDNH